MTPMMKCGHAANCTDQDGKPGCAICIGLSRGADEVDTAPPELSGRMAKCTCGRTEPSDPKALAFFEYCGPGSRTATDTCKCGYSFAPHTPEGMERNVASNRKTVIEQGKCTGFVASGPREFDRYYCGCRGWD